MYNKIIEYKNHTDKLTMFIYVYLFFMPWNFFKGQMGTLTVLLFISWIIKYKKDIFKKLKLLFDSKPIVLLLIFIAYTYSATLWSDSFKDAFSYVNNFYKYYLLLIPILFTSLNKDTAKVSVKVFFISFVSYAIFSLGIYFELYTIKGSSPSDPKGLMAYAIVSIYMSLATVWGLGIFCYSNNKKDKKIFFLIILLAIFTLFINNSRTSQISLILTILVLFIFYFQAFSIKNKIYYLCILVIYFFLINPYIHNKFQREYIVAYKEMQNVINNKDYEGSFGVRLYFYKAGFQVIKSNLLFGAGPLDNKEQLINIQKRDLDYTNKKIFSSYHSQHLDILTGYGIVGYILILLSCILLAYKLKHIRKYYYLCLSFLLTVFFNALGNVILIKKPFNYIFISLFVIFAVISFYEKKEVKN